MEEKPTEPNKDIPLIDKKTNEHPKFEPIANLLKVKEDDTDKKK